MATQTKQIIPLFPLPEVVLFPGGALPMHIFEPRYREMVKDVLAGDSVFGILNVDPLRREPAQVGCGAEIVEVTSLPDGRMNILAVGTKRFRISEFLTGRSYLQGKVDWLEDREPERDLLPLASEMGQVLRDVVRLSAKLADRQIEFPDDLPDAPVDLSFWVAGSFPGLPDEQQALLEMVDTGARLRRETEILASARKQLAARTALKDALG
jgi:ATP-dependent Lon protease